MMRVLLVNGCGLGGLGTTMTRQVWVTPHLVVNPPIGYPRAAEVGQTV